MQVIASKKVMQIGLKTLLPLSDELIVKPCGRDEVCGERVLGGQEKRVS